MWRCALTPGSSLCVTLVSRTATFTAVLFPRLCVEVVTLSTCPSAARERWMRPDTVSSLRTRSVSSGRSRCGFNSKQHGRCCCYSQNVAGGGRKLIKSEPLRLLVLIKINRTGVSNTDFLERSSRSRDTREMLVRFSGGSSL